MPNLGAASNTTITPKRYRAVRPSEITPHVFELEVYRGDVPEVHTFTARPNTDLGPLIQLHGAIDDPMKMGQTALKVLVKQMDDSDGVPLAWEPTELPKPKNAGHSYEPKFRGPDGKLHSMAERGKFLAFQAGSSRRRWQYLLLEDDGISIDAPVLMAIMSDLIQAATGRPTPA
jgi:hypothetical protein